MGTGLVPIPPPNSVQSGAAVYVYLVTLKRYMARYDNLGCDWHMSGIYTKCLSDNIVIYILHIYDSLSHLKLSMNPLLIELPSDRRLTIGTWLVEAILMLKLPLHG